MQKPENQLLIPDITDIGFAELSATLGEDVRLNEPGAITSNGRDFTTTTAIVTVSLAALRVLAVWITRHTQREETVISVQTTRANGSPKTITFKHSSSSAQSEAHVLQQLASACRVDLGDTPGVSEEQK